MRPWVCQRTGEPGAHAHCYTPAAGHALLALSPFVVAMGTQTGLRSGLI